MGRRAGIRMAGQARQFLTTDFERFDLLIAMDAANLADLGRLAPSPEARSKLRLLRSYDPAAAPGLRSLIHTTATTPASTRNSNSVARRVATYSRRSARSIAGGWRLIDVCGANRNGANDQDLAQALPSPLEISGR